MYINLKPNKHKIISFNTTTITSLGFIIVEPPPRGWKGGSRTFPKIESLEGGREGTKFFAREGDKPVKGGLM